MKVPDNKMLEDMNWADYCDALRSKSFLQSVNERTKSEKLEYPTAGTNHEKSGIEKLLPESP